MRVAVWVLTRGAGDARQAPRKVAWTRGRTWLLQCARRGVGHRLSFVSVARSMPVRPPLGRVGVLIADVVPPWAVGRAAGDGFANAVAALNAAERREGKPLAALRGSARAAALESAREAIREVCTEARALGPASVRPSSQVYRYRWSTPHRRTVMSSVPHLMIWGDADSDGMHLRVDGGEASRADLRGRVGVFCCSGGGGGGGRWWGVGTVFNDWRTGVRSHGGALPLLRALSRQVVPRSPQRLGECFYCVLSAPQVFREYQRKLWDPEPPIDADDACACGGWHVILGKAL